MPDVQALAALLIECLDDEVLDLLREDPFEAIPLAEPSVTISRRFQVDGLCSVDGLYDEATRHITVLEALSPRRTKFTALHEFGHDQARHSGPVARALAIPLEASRRLEERIADAFAAAILVPDRVVDEVLNGRQPTAVDVTAVFRHDGVGGSREAVCVKVAHRMRGNGYVLVAQDGAILFSVTVGTAYTVARGSQQEEGHLLERAATHGTATQPDVRLRHQSGAVTGRYAGQAVFDDGYVFAVLTDSTMPPWGGWLAPRDERPDAPEMYCEDCDEVVEAWKRCDTDGRHRTCGICSWCACRAARRKVPERRCAGCDLMKRVDLFDGDLCRDCV
jgi:hypothetical protein